MSRPSDLSELYTLKVDNISYRTAREDLDSLFGKYGKIGDIYIPRDGRSGDSRGFAFVRFFHKRDAEDALDEIHGRKYDGRELRVQFAKNKKTEREDFEGPRGGRLRYRSRSRSRRRSRSRGRYRSRTRSRSRSRSRDRRRSKSRSRSRSRNRSRSASRSKSRERSKSSGRY